jgi:hypothetical protein
MNKLALRNASAWLTGFLIGVGDAAQRAGQELTRLQAVEAKAMRLQRTSRSCSATIWMERERRSGWNLRPRLSG